jgi:hypothetical protein
MFNIAILPDENDAPARPAGRRPQTAWNPPHGAGESPRSVWKPPHHVADPPPTTAKPPRTVDTPREARGHLRRTCGPPRATRRHPRPMRGMLRAACGRLRGKNRAVQEKAGRTAAPWRWAPPPSRRRPECRRPCGREKGGNAGDEGDERRNLPRSAKRQDRKNRLRAAIHKQLLQQPLHPNDAAQITAAPQSKASVFRALFLPCSGGLRPPVMDEDFGGQRSLSDFAITRKSSPVGRAVPASRIGLQITARGSPGRLALPSKPETATA